MLTSLEEQEDLEFAGAPLPAVRRKRAVWASTHLVAMPSAIEAGEAGRLWTLRYLSDHSLDWARGQVPVRKSILHSPAFQKLQVQYAFSKELPYIVYEPPTVSYKSNSPVL